VKRPLALLAASYAVICLLMFPASLLAAARAPVTSSQPEAPNSNPAPSPASPLKNGRASTANQSAEQSAASARQAPPPTAGQTSHPSAVAAGSGSVTIHDFAFAPGTLTVHVGDRVTWFNQGPSSHSATANDGSFDTGVLSKGTSGSFTFTTPGTFSYHCTPHPFMHGSITVLAASSGSGSGSTKGGSAGSTASGKTSGGGGSSSQPNSGTAQAGLPKTGFDVAAVAGLGLVLLGLGSLVRRSAATRS
jgi:LPXTG-motif cell wall-anchored protein